MSRTYKSPLREEQAEQTRQKLLDTLQEMLAGETDDEITVASVAERAKISVRTAYRYFPTRDAMIDAFNEWSRLRMGSPPMPTTVEALPEMAGNLFASFERNEQALRAIRRSAPSAALRRRRKVEQMRAMRLALEKYAPHLDELRARQIGAVFHAAFGSDIWFLMKDTWGLTTPEAIEAVQWTVDALVTKLAAEKARKGRK